MSDHHFGRRSSALSAFMSRARGEMVPETTTTSYNIVTTRSTSNQHQYNYPTTTTTRTQDNQVQHTNNGNDVSGGGGGGGGGDTSFLNMLSRRIINTRTGPPLSHTHAQHLDDDRNGRGSFSQPYARGLQYPSPITSGGGDANEVMVADNQDHQDYLHSHHQHHTGDVVHEEDVYKPYYAIAERGGGGARSGGSYQGNTDSVATAYRAIRDRNGKGYWGGGAPQPRGVAHQQQHPHQRAVAPPPTSGGASVRGISPITPNTNRSAHRINHSHMTTARTANFFPQGALATEEEGYPTADDDANHQHHYQQEEGADHAVLGGGGQRRSTSGPYDTPATTPLQIARDTTAAHQHIADMYAASATRNRRASNTSSVGQHHYSRGVSGLNQSAVVSRTSSGGGAIQRRVADGLSVYEQALQSITVHGGDTQRAYRGKKSGASIINGGRTHTPNNNSRGPSARDSGDPNHRLVRDVDQQMLRLATPTLLSMIDASGQLHYDTYKTDPRTWERVSSVVEAERRSSMQLQQPTQEQLMRSPEERWKRQLRDESRRDAQDGVWHTDRFQPSPRKSPGLQRLPLEPKRRGLYFEDVDNTRGKLPFDPCACTKYSPRVGGGDGGNFDQLDGDSHIIVSSGPHRTVLGDGEEPGNFSPPRPEVSGGEWGPHAGYTTAYQAQQPPTVEEAALEVCVGSRSHSALDHHASHYVHDHCLHDTTDDPATVHPPSSTPQVLGHDQPPTSRQSLLEMELLTEREKSGRTSLWAAFEEKFVDFSVLFYQTKPHAQPTTTTTIQTSSTKTMVVGSRQGSGSHPRVDGDGEYLESLNPINVAAPPSSPPPHTEEKYISPPSHYRPGFAPEQHPPSTNATLTASRPEWRSPSPPQPGESFPPLSASPKRSMPAPSLEQQVREGLFKVHQSRSYHVNTMRSASADTAPPGTPNRNDGDDRERASSSSLPPPPPPLDMYQKMLDREKSFATEKQQWGEVYGEMKKALRSMADKNTELVRQVSASQPASTAPSRSHSRTTSPNRDVSVTGTDIGSGGGQQRSLSPDGALKATLRADFSPRSAYYDEY